MFLLSIGIFLGTWTSAATFGWVCWIYSQFRELQTNSLHEWLLEFEQGLHTYQWYCQNFEFDHYISTFVHVQMANV